MVDALALTRDGTGVLSLAGERLSFARADARSVPITRVLTTVGARQHWFAMPQYRSQFQASLPRPRITIEGSGKRALVVGPRGELWEWPLILPAALSAPRGEAGAAPVQTAAAWTARVVGGKVEVTGPGGTPRHLLSPQGSLGGLEGVETSHLFASDFAAVAVWHVWAGQWTMSAYSLPDGGKIFDMGSAGDLNCLAIAPRATHIAWCRTRFTPDIVPLPPEVAAMGSGTRVQLPVPSMPAIDTTGSGFHFVRGLAFSPDGRSVVIWGEYMDAVVARTDGTGSPVYLTAPSSQIVAASFTADGRRVRLVTSDRETNEVAIDFSEAARLLGTRIGGCLAVPLRVQYLSESDSVSRARYRECEARRWPRP
jgi:hypothetical protein